ncbi:hypothetical protein ACRE1U_07075 [Helicobacter himalayensis]|uniref:hypothetical protein n=1 Tax=Helicobacter himalayensis TaxID=1591088 RepID=UPI003D6EAA45
MRELQFFKNEKVLFGFGGEYHKPYFQTLSRLLPHLHKCVNVSFIAEYMMIDSQKMCELIEVVEKRHSKPFWSAILDCIDDENLGASGFSEFETYGSFIALTYPQSYVFKKRKYDRFAKEIIGATPSKAQLKWYARSYEICGLESWGQETFLSQLTQYAIVRNLTTPKILRRAKNLYDKLKRCFSKI